MKNIENSDVRLEEIITIINKVRVIGSDNSYRYFIPYYQYIFCDTSVLTTTECNYCNQVDNHEAIGPMLHYKLCLDDVSYWIPKWAAVVEGKLRTEWEQNSQLRVERDAEKSGIAVMVQGHVEYNGYEFGKAHGIKEDRQIDDIPTDQGS